jgi:hypothetical protein
LTYLLGDTPCDVQAPGRFAGFRADYLGLNTSYANFTGLITQVGAHSMGTSMKGGEHCVMQDLQCTVPVQVMLHTTL